MYSLQPAHRLCTTRRTSASKTRAQLNPDIIPPLKYEAIRLKNKMFAAANHARQVSSDPSSTIEYCITSWLIVNKLHNEYNQKKTEYEMQTLREKETEFETMMRIADEKAENERQ